MSTRVTLELPAHAAKKLAALTPEQRSELSALLGCEVRSITVQPTLATRRKQVNDELHALGLTYHSIMPWAELDAILSRGDFNPVEISLVPLALGKEGRVHTNVGNDTWVTINWYRMASGRFEVVAYVS